MADKIKEISVFVDESGTFDSDAVASQFYLVCMVFHDQSEPITDGVRWLNDALAQLGLSEDHAVHAGPLVRWEPPYRNFRGPERRAIFSHTLPLTREIVETAGYRCPAIITPSGFVELTERGGDQ